MCKTRREESTRERGNRTGRSRGRTFSSRREYVHEANVSTRCSLHTAQSPSRKHLSTTQSITPLPVNQRQLQIRIEVIRRSRSTALHMRFYNRGRWKSNPSHSDKLTRATLPVVGSPPNPLHSLGGVELLVCESKCTLTSA
jgi:hypothetical protein